VHYSTIVKKQLGYEPRSSTWTTHNHQPPSKLTTPVLKALPMELSSNVAPKPSTCVSTGSGTKLQHQFVVHWRKGADNLADYFTKHHSRAHHRLMRSRSLLDLHRPSASIHSGEGVLIHQGSSDSTMADNQPLAEYEQDSSSTTDHVSQAVTPTINLFIPQPVDCLVTSSNQAPHKC
jgi:hypothetical protein